MRTLIVGLLAGAVGCLGPSERDAPIEEMDVDRDIGATLDAGVDAFDTNHMDAALEVSVTDTPDADLDADPCASVTCDEPFCDGNFTCVGGACVLIAARSCDDGNDCTIDYCDRSVDACASELSTMCDGGTGFDAGTPCPAWAPGDLAGTYYVTPELALDCVEVWRVRDLTLTVDGGDVVLSGGPVPSMRGPSSGESFVAVGSSSCGTYTVRGRFTCRDRFEGTLTSAYEGACSICGSGEVSFTARRR
jgi:hypothetical protein